MRKLDAQIVKKEAAAVASEAAYKAYVAVVTAATKIDPKMGALNLQRAALGAVKVIKENALEAEQALVGAAVDLSKISAGKLFSITGVSVSGGSLSHAQGGGGVSASVTDFFFGHEKTFSTSSKLARRIRQRRQRAPQPALIHPGLGAQQVPTQRLAGLVPARHTKRAGGK